MGLVKNCFRQLQKTFFPQNKIQKGETGYLIVNPFERRSLKSLTRGFLTTTIRKHPLSTSTSANGTGAGAGAAQVEKYSSPLVVLHWLVGAGIITCIGTVKLSQWTPKDNPKKFGMTKLELMNVHKSTAVLVLALMVPRIAFRFAHKVPVSHTTNVFEKLAASFTHGFLYIASVMMPLSGMAMAYQSGKGIPFFGYNFPGAETPNKALAGQIYEKHKLFGQALTYVVSIHVGAVGFHFVRGQNVLRRMLL